MTATAVMEAPPPVILDHISYSSIKTYQTCPRKFAYKYIEQVTEEFKPSSLAFGSAFHSAVERVQEARIQGLNIPALDEIMAAFETAWSNETIGAEIQYCKEEDAGSLHELARRMLDAYLAYASLEATLPEQAQIISIEHSNRFRLLADVPAVESRIDLLELQGTDLVVSDLKSSKSRWNDTKVLESVPQLVLYSIGLLPLMRELGATRIITKFVVVTKAKKTPVVQVLQPQCSQDDVIRLKQTIAETWTAIQTGLFVKRESWACAQCPFKNRCLGR